MSEDGPKTLLTRRALVLGGATGAGLLLSGCDQLGHNETFRKILFSADGIHHTLQRSLQGDYSLAKEFSPSDMSPIFRQNGTINPGTPEYAAHAAANFATWRLKVDGEVNHPLDLSLAQVKALPARTQITRHDCVEGWSAVGKWHGPMMGNLLKAAGVKDSARYIIIHCADLYHGKPYYESLDMFEAFHPQTILAWAMNDALLSIGTARRCGCAPSGIWGYKQAKYVTRLQAVKSLDGIYGGHGGYWEDNVDYDTYGGI